MRPQLIDGNKIYIPEGLEYNPQGSSLIGEYPKIVNDQLVNNAEEEAALTKKTKKTATED